LQVRRAFQRRAGALEGHHHAEQGAQHPQQHQQADQVRRQGGRRQGHALAFDAQAHRAAQARVQRLKPGAQLGRRLGQAGHGVREGGRGLPVAVQFERTRQVAGADQQGDGQRQRVRADVTEGNPADGSQAGEEDNERKVMSGHGVPVSGCEALRAALRPVENEPRVQRAARAACPCGTRPATRRAAPPQGRRRPAAAARPRAGARSAHPAAWAPRPADSAPACRAPAPGWHRAPRAAPWRACGRTAGAAGGRADCRSPSASLAEAPDSAAGIPRSRPPRPPCPPGQPGRASVLRHPVCPGPRRCRHP